MSNDQSTIDARVDQQYVDNRLRGSGSRGRRGET